MEATKTHGNQNITYCTVRNSLMNSMDSTSRGKSALNTGNKPTCPNFYEKAGGHPWTKSPTDPQTLGKAKDSPTKGSA